MVKISYMDTENVLAKLKELKFNNKSYFKLNHLANMLQLKGKRSELISADELKGKITLYPHQIEAALRYLNEMNGRILLADEVGLGKTIEAGIILKELIMRGEINRVLILAPASLLGQWQVEMADKFGLSFEINRSVHNWNRYDMIISSIDTAKKTKHIDEINRIKWDLIIIDEAHRLRNRTTKAYKAFQNLKANNRLFLTATPIQNNIMDLYNLLDLLDNGYLGTISEFNMKYVADDKGIKVNNVKVLQDKLRKIMMRTTRTAAGLEFTKRDVYTTLIEPSEEEDKFMDIAIQFIRDRYNEVIVKEQEEKDNLKGLGTLQLMAMTRMLCSCRYAFAKSFEKYLKNNITDPLRLQEGTKILELNEKLGENKKFNQTIDLVKKINDKIIIFTQFKATQESLEDRLEKEGFKVAKLNGSMNLQEKKNAVLKIKGGEAQILICTEAGGEGLNLQFCHNLINYDLPWNPMRVEQRIGRIHRIGQLYDVKIYNLSINGTIEEYILKKLYEKIELFHTAIGEMGDIISHVTDGGSFQKCIFEIIMKNNKKIDIQKKMDELFKNIKDSKKFQEQIKQFDKRTLEVFNLSPLKNE